MADRLPKQLTRLRTMFSAFHHFRTEQAGYVASAVLIPLFDLLMMPRVRPFTFFRLFFTYVLPVLPALFCNCARTQSAN